MEHIVNNFTVIMTCFGLFFFSYLIIMPLINLVKEYRMTDKAIESSLTALVIGLIFYFIVKLFANGTILQGLNPDEWLMKPVELNGKSMLAIMFGPELLAIILSPIFEKRVFKDRNSSDPKEKPAKKYKSPQRKYIKRKINDNYSCLVSVEEDKYFDKYFEMARNNDKGITVDIDMADKKVTVIIAGALFANCVPLNEAVEMAKKDIGKALITLEDTTEDSFGKLTASCFKDIHFAPEFARDNRIPFWGLFKTCETIRPESALTLFPATEALVWENLVNRPYLLACRRIIPTETEPTLKNWKGQINFNDLRAFDDADLIF